MDLYRKTYCFNVNPVKGQDLWKKKKTESPALVPPPIKPKLGRPTMKRRKDRTKQPSGSKTKLKRNCCWCRPTTTVDASSTGAIPVVRDVGSDNSNITNLIPSPPAQAPIATKIAITQLESFPSTQQTQQSHEVLQDKARRRSPKLQIVKGKATTNTSPKAFATTPMAISAETIKGISSTTAKKLRELMHFMPTPGASSLLGRKINLVDPKNDV
ncbi:hypothetical protein PIB30_047875 [Stylosanthes scabra]|uniref:Uncharacterized protein n=1 Tax=Stylosanthes scabra TaxID=79078 RepID=A0ABU6XEP9_9FABA|nr:hypothetical protein [Stylosanthes scabra]